MVSRAEEGESQSLELSVRCNRKPRKGMAAHSGLADLKDNGTSDRKVQEMTVSASRALLVLVARMSRILETVHTVLVTSIYSTAARGRISPGYSILRPIGTGPHKERGRSQGN